MRNTFKVSIGYIIVSVLSYVITMILAMFNINTVINNDVLFSFLIISVISAIAFIVIGLYSEYRIKDFIISIIITGIISLLMLLISGIFPDTTILMFVAIFVESIVIYSKELFLWLTNNEMLANVLAVVFSTLYPFVFIFVVNAIKKRINK